jgi:CMP-N-acetylneuraminic acid synthetase
VSQLVAIVPARSGSTRIPGKNRKSFLGIPIIFRILDTLRSAGIFDIVLVSTDDPDLASEVKKQGFSAPFVRPAALATEFASTGEVANHAVEYLLSEGLPVGSSFFLMYPTAVMTTGEDIVASYEMFAASGCELLFAAAKFPSEIYRAWMRDDGNQLRPVFPGNQATRSQDFRPAYFDAGQFYWFKAGAWREEVLERGVGREIYELHPLQAVDINTEADWLLAEQLFVFQSRATTGSGMQ